MRKPARNIGHNGTVTSTSLNYAARAQKINRPNPVAVGTIVWLGSEVMFFAGLFAIYFTLRSVAPDLWASETSLLNIPFSTTNTIILVASSFTCQFGVFAAERMQPRSVGPKPSQWGMVEWFFLTYALGAIFVAGQIFEYATLVSEGLSLTAQRSTSQQASTVCTSQAASSRSCSSSVGRTPSRPSATRKRQAPSWSPTTGTSSTWSGSASSSSSTY
jgi:heme/copper-type cytochrome/quinol oxidase subunit 3